MPAPSELATPALAPVLSGVGSKPPIGMPWAPKAITRTTSELSRPIRIASCKRHRPDFLGLGIVGRARLGHLGQLHLQRAAQELGLLDFLVLQRDSAQVVVRDRLGLVDVGKPLTTGRRSPRPRAMPPEATGSCIRSIAWPAILD